MKKLWAKITARNVNKAFYPYLLALPTLIVLILMNLYPLIYSIKISLTDYNLAFGLKPEYVGIQNFIRLFKDVLFLKSFWLTVQYVLGAVLIEFSAGLIIALLLHRLQNKGRIILTLFLLPMMLTPIIVGLMWRFMLNYDVGIVNFIIETLGLKRFPFLANQSTALFSIIIVDAWQWTPFMVLLLYSGLQSMPTDPFEAGKIDGASEFQMFRYITLPTLKPIILISLLIRGMDAFREYDKIYTMTNGGPGNCTETASFYIYRVAFKFFEVGYGAAAAFVLLVISVFVCKQFVSRLPE